MMAAYQHTTVLLNEAIEMLNIQSDGTYVDCTLGGGGHSQAILDHLGPEGRLVVFDHDEDAWANVPDDDRVLLVKENFQHLQRFLKHFKIDGVDGILADLGVSSHHFDTPLRGFTYRQNGPMDMRMDVRGSMTAADVLARYDESELVRVFSRYGEVPNSKSLARAIVSHRDVERWDDVDTFLEFLKPYQIGDPVKYKSKVFQALRIEVNQELESLEKLLLAAPDVLVKGGRLVIISFHSLEDKIVKNMTKPQVISEDILTGRKIKETVFETINKKPIQPSADEVKNNNRARSAKMRVLEKL